MVSVYVGSEKALKRDAIEALFILLGYDPAVLGFKAESDVPEQPRTFLSPLGETGIYQSIDETLEGAFNRMQDLLQRLVPHDAPKPHIAAAVESGLFHKNIHAYDVLTGQTIIGRSAERGMQAGQPGWVDIAP